MAKMLYKKVMNYFKKFTLVKDSLKTESLLLKHRFCKFYRILCILHEAFDAGKQASSA